MSNPINVNNEPVVEKSSFNYCRVVIPTIGAFLTQFIQAEMFYSFLLK